MKSIEPRRLPCGTPAFITNSADSILFSFTVNVRFERYAAEMKISFLFIFASTSLRRRPLIQTLSMASSTYISTAPVWFPVKISRYIFGCSKNLVFSGVAFAEAKLFSSNSRVSI